MNGESTPVIADNVAANSETIENLSPGMVCPVVVESEDGKLNVVNMTWGLIPAYSEITEKPNHFTLFNKRIDTLARPGYFRKLAESRRCLVVLDGFYEWKKQNGSKQPYYVSYHDRPLQIAGIFENSKRLNGSGGVVTFPTFSILTGQPSEKFSALHNREPVLLTDEQALRWVDASVHLDELLSELVANSAQESLNINADLDYHPVTREVGKPSYQGLDCAIPIDAKEVEHTGSKDIQTFFKPSATPVRSDGANKRKIDGDNDAPRGAVKKTPRRLEPATAAGSQRKTAGAALTPVNPLSNYFAKSRK